MTQPLHSKTEIDMTKVTKPENQDRTATSPAIEKYRGKSKDEINDMIESQMNALQAAVELAKSGGHVALICRNLFDRKQKLEQLVRKFKLSSVVVSPGQMLQFPSGGSIAFLQLLCIDGRNVDDFETVLISPDRIENENVRVSAPAKAYWAD